MSSAAPEPESPPAPPRPFRVLPRLGGRDEHVWLGGEHGELRMLRCQADGTWIHPASPRCPVCLGDDLAVEPTSGRGVVHAVTVNHQPWYPGLDPPYAIAIVELGDQAGLRFTTNVVGCPPDDVSIGMPVRVTFEQYDDVWLPFFTPEAG